MNKALEIATPSHSRGMTFIQQSLRIFSGVCLLAIAAQVSIPFQPVPLTFQTVAVLFISMTCGARYGTAVVISYLCAGAMGIPVFANFSAGMNVVFTSGYLLGFVPAAFVSGYLAENGYANTFTRALLTASMGASIIFFCGVSVLTTMIGFEKAITVGLLPFLISEPLKLTAVAFMAKRYWANK